MTKTTVAGTAHKVGDISRAFSPNGNLQDAHMIRKIELELPDAGLKVTLDHDHTNVVGQVVYAELDRDEHLNVVSVIDGDWIRSVEEPVYYSGEFDCRGPTSSLAQKVWIAERAYVIGMSLTLRPAHFAAQPLRFLPGDVRSSADRGSWPHRFGWPARLLERAVDKTPQGEIARRIENLTPSPEQEEAAYYAAAAADYYRSHPHAAHRQNPGAIEYSPWRGRVLSVR